jgi:flavin reductase (DIM6/NTAB) family NADH-FMN oxidoreductase RutF
MILDPEGLTAPDRYRMLISAIVPRPIAWVTTVSPGGVVNAAPYSFFNGICSTPPLLAVCIGRRRDGSEKDTLRNARDTGEMVVNVAPRDLAREMVATSEEFPPEVSEPEVVGLALAASEVVKPPRLAGSPVNLECRVEQLLPFEGTTMVVGRVLRVHVRDDLWVKGQVDFDALCPVGRLGGTSYLDPVTGRFEIPRPGNRGGGA